MFQVDINELMNNKFQLMIQDTNTQTTTTDSWFYWEYEFFIKSLNDKNKSDKEQQDKQDKEQNDKMGDMSSYSPSKMLSGLGASTSSLPRF